MFCLDFVNEVFPRGKTGKGSTFLFKGDSLINALGKFLVWAHF